MVSTKPLSVEKQGRLWSIRYEEIGQIEPNSLYTIADVQQPET
jgi:hypothetical protein